VVKKTILFLLPELYPCNTGGVEIFHYYFVKKVSNYYNIIISTRCTDYVSDIENIKVFPFHYCNFSNTFSKYVNNISTILSNRSEIELVHVPYTSKNVFQDYYLIMLNKMKIPYILRIHGGGMHPSRPFFLHDQLFQKAAGVIAVNDHLKDEYEKRHRRKIDVIPSMLPFLAPRESREELRRQHGIPHDALTMCFVGTLKEIKGPKILSRAFRLLGEDYVSARKMYLVFAGGGECLSLLKSEVQGTFWEDHILFLGQIPYERVCTVYEISDLFIIPSLFEARPLTLSEALYNGVPAIASDIPSISSMIRHGHNGLLFRAGKSDDLASTIRLAAEHPELRQRLGSQARFEYRNRYKYDEMVASYVTFYEEALNGRQ
jgi:glycosyltransferase involved in cell wall biosynthesis